METNDEARTEYDFLLYSGMFWEFYPDLTGDYEQDKGEWDEEFNRLKGWRSFNATTKVTSDDN